MQRFAQGVIHGMAVLAGNEHEVVDSNFGGCRHCGQSVVIEDQAGLPHPAPIPVGLISNDLQAFGLYSPNNSSLSSSTPLFLASTPSPPPVS